MVLLGKRAWWLPKWMDRVIPHISIEGEEYFAKKDAAKDSSRDVPAQPA
jgi:RND superfamily putative drug exporter